MNVIITGSNGFIGSHLVKKFIEAGDEVYAIVKDCHEDISHLNGCKHIYYCEIDKLDTLYEEFKNIEKPIFYHLAWAGVNGESKANYNTQILNIKMTLDAASFAKRINASCFFCAGTIAEKAIDSFPFLETISGSQMYGVGKVSARLFLEAFCKNIKLKFVWLRFSNIYGPDNKTGNLVSYTITQLRDNKEACFGPGLQLYDFIYVDDLIDAIYKLGKKNSHTFTDYFIGSGSPRLLKDYLMEIGVLFGKPELIKIGERQDDGIKYSCEMFDISATVLEIGEYITKDFTCGIKQTIQLF